jgi:hypothetical protein
MFFTEEIKYEKIQKILLEPIEAIDTAYNFGGVEFVEQKNLLFIAAKYRDESGGLPEDRFGNAQGAVHVYEKQGETFVYNQKIVSSDLELGDLFGRAISLSDDGNVLVVAASGEDPNDVSNSGAVYVFEYQNGTYVQTQKLQPSNPEENKSFGWNVEISSDGELITVTSLRGDGELTFRVYVFEKQGTSFVQTQEIIPSQLEGFSFFGDRLKISSDNNFLVIPHRALDIETTINAGKVYIYEKQNGIFVETQALQEEAPIANYNLFGSAVAISSDDSLIYVGCQNSDKAATNAGAVYVYKKVDNLWTLDYEIFPDDNLGGGTFGYGIALSDDDNHLVVSALTDSTVDSGSGAVYVFSKKSGKMRQVEKPLPDYTGEISDGSHSQNFGERVEISSDGSLVFISSPREAGLGVEDLGALYILKRS